MVILICLGFCCLVWSVHAAFADVFEGAEWIRHPIFEGHEPIDVYHKEKAPAPPNPGPRNVHTFFRKETVLPAAPKRAILWVTGDDYYKLYLNGAFVVQGPEPGYPFAHPYYVLDVTEHLAAGPNCIAAHGYYQGLRNRVWNSGDNRAGFIAILDILDEGGGITRVATDGSWRCLRCKAFPSDTTIGYQTQFAEPIDMRQIPKGWRLPGFDDAGWAPPLVGRQDHEFVRQLTPPLEHRRAEPVHVAARGEGRFLYDFGAEIVGETRIHMQGPEGHVLEVRHGEELTETGEVRFGLRARCDYQEFPVLSGKDDTIEFYDYRGFRYIEILNAPSAPEVWVNVRHHPFDVDAAVFSAPDRLAMRIWELCKNGVRYGCQGGFLDCPTREKGQYLGDALITGRAHLVLTADGSLNKKALQDFRFSQRICPGMMAVAPGSLMQEIAEYSLQWPLALLNYYHETGDRHFVQQMAEEGLGPLLGYFERYEGEHGLLTGVDEKWVLVDWPENLRDGYDYDYAKTRENTVLNAFYYRSLEAAAELLEALELDSDGYRERAARVKEAFQARLLDEASGLFLDAPGSAHSSLHANAIPLAFGLVAPENVPKVVELIRRKRLSCGVYIAPFVIEACYRAGEPELAYDLLTSKDEHSWHEMLKHGATTCMEVWGPDQKSNTSWCHPWSSGPVFLISEYVMGLSPSVPGWKAVRFAPQLPASWEEAHFRRPIPQGRVTVEYARASGFVLTVPPGVEADVQVPEGVPARIERALDHARGPLSEAQRAVLAENRWEEQVGVGRGVWVSVDEQVLRIIEGDAVVWQARCSTAAKGTGQVENSFQTPLGWHRVAGKIGAGAPWGQVFRGGQPVAGRWRPGEETEEDLVLTRILHLAGEEPGKNQGGQVDSYRRYIYIHGTNGEEELGMPSSHGCVRLGNSEVIEAFDRIPEKCPVLITEAAPWPEARPQQP